MFSLLAGGQAERAVRLGQLAGARRRTRRREPRRLGVVGDPEPQRATPLDGLERPELLGLGPEPRSGPLRADLDGGAREPCARGGRVLVDAGERRVEPLGRAPHTLHRPAESLQAFAGGGELLIGTRTLALEGGEALMLIEGRRHLLHRGTQRLAGAPGRLTLWARNSEPLLHSAQGESARPARGLPLPFPIGDYQPLALALAP